MRFFRPFLATLSALALAASLAAQTESADITALRAKAEHGNSVAQYNLGLAYAQGNGVTTDPVEAFVWLSLAGENGARGQALNNVVNSLTPDQLTQARQKLAERRLIKGILVPASATPPPAETRVSAPPPPASSSDADLQRALATAATDEAQLSAELAKAWNETEELKAKLVQAEGASTESTRLKSDRDALSNKVALLTSELTTLRSDRDNARGFGQQVEETLNKVNEQKTALESQLRTAQEQLRAANQKSDSLNTELAQKQSAAAAGSADAAALKDLQARYA